MTSLLKTIKISLTENSLTESVSQGKRMIRRQMRQDLSNIKNTVQSHRNIADFHKDCLATATRVDDAEHSQFMSDLHTNMAKIAQGAADKLEAKLKRK